MPNFARNVMSSCMLKKTGSVKKAKTGREQDQR